MLFLGRQKLRSFVVIFILMNYNCLSQISLSANVTRHPHYIAFCKSELNPDVLMVNTTYDVGLHENSLPLSRTKMQINLH